MNEIDIDMEERLSDVSDIATRNEQANIAMRLEERRLAMLHQEAPDEDASGNRYCLDCADTVPALRVKAVNAVRCVVCAEKRERLLKLGAQRGGASLLQSRDLS